MSHGWNSTCYQIINPGIEHWFAAAGDAVVGYVKAAGFRVVAGAPVCPLDRLPGVTAEFEGWATRTGTRVCYFGAEERLVAHYRNNPGYARLLLGSQPAWRPAIWPEMLRKNSSLRAQLNRARNKRVIVEEWPAEKASGHPALRQCLDEWLSTRGLPPLHFLIEPETLSRLYDRRVFVAERDGGVEGFLIASPIPGRKGWLIEQNIRRSNAPNGCSELLVDGAVRFVNQSEAEYITLGLSPLSRKSGNSVESPLWLRAALAWVRAHGNRFYNFEGLEAFKSKFHPENWEPIYAISNQKSITPATLYAIAAAFSQSSPITAVARGFLKSLKTEAHWLTQRVRRH